MIIVMVLAPSDSSISLSNRITLGPPIPPIKNINSHGTGKLRDHILLYLNQKILVSNI